MFINVEIYLLVNMDNCKLCNFSEKRENSKIIPLLGRFEITLLSPKLDPSYHEVDGT
jgi:hypothetical protein